MGMSNNIYLMPAKPIRTISRRFTPPEEFRRFAESLYNYNPYMRTKGDYNKTIDDFMDGNKISPVLKEKAFESLKQEFLPELGSEKEETTKQENKNKIKVRKEVKIKFPKDHLARIWDSKSKHHKTIYVSEHKTKQGRTVYKDDKGRNVRVIGIKESRK